MKEKEEEKDKEEKEDEENEDAEEEQDDRQEILIPRVPPCSARIVVHSYDFSCSAPGIAKAPVITYSMVAKFNFQFCAGLGSIYD